MICVEDVEIEKQHCSCILDCISRSNITGMTKKNIISHCYFTLNISLFGCLALLHVSYYQTFHMRREKALRMKTTLTDVFGERNTILGNSGWCCLSVNVPKSSKEQDRAANDSIQDRLPHSREILHRSCASCEQGFIKYNL